MKKRPALPPARIDALAGFSATSDGPNIIITATGDGRCVYAEDIDLAEPGAPGVRRSLDTRQVPVDLPWLLEAPARRWLRTYSFPTKSTSPW